MEKVYSVAAAIDNWDDVYSFLDCLIKDVVSEKKVRTSVLVACEEIFVNISTYAYKHLDFPGDVTIKFLYDSAGNEICITFIDSGTQFDSTKAGCADITSSVQDRKIGGLGIFLVKQIMDKMEYEYTQNQNVLKLTKKLHSQNLLKQ
ncbi:MAG: ATP-binding protein [Oscillospiraceae bacterium]|nr:ATP-binding protein [Oscillospiraceae bacterium]